MNQLHHHLSQLAAVRRLVETKDTTYYRHQVLNPHPITERTISIVMTSHERAQQVYYTLQLLNNSQMKDIQVILVDDSIQDRLSTERLQSYGIHMDWIEMDPTKKFWANPCINYNLGFQYIQGGKVIIQNSEVCHVGDVLDYVDKQVTENRYDVFDVVATKGFQANELLYYQPRLDTGIINENLWVQWYQHHQYRNVMYHFLCATTKTTFDRIGGFSYDYAFGACYDDDDFVLKIRHSKILMHPVSYSLEQVAGIHLFHDKHHMADRRAYTSPLNTDLFEKKTRYLLKNQAYLELSEQSEEKKEEAFRELNQY